MAEDRAQVRAMVVAMVQRLEQKNGDVDPPGSRLPPGVDCGVALGTARHYDQLVPAADGLLSEDGNAGEFVTHRESTLIASQSPDVSTLGVDQVLPRGCDGSVRARGGQLELPLGELRTDIQQVEVGPFVIAEGFNQYRAQSRPMITLGKLSRHGP